MKKTTYMKLNTLHDALVKFNNLLPAADIAALKEQIENAREEWDERSEAWQQGENGVAEGDRIAAAEAVVEALEAMVESKESAVNAFTDMFEISPEGIFDKK